MKERLTESGIPCSVASQRFCGRHEQYYYKLREFEDKMEQGLLVELPCKVDDTFYEVIRGLPIQEWKVCAIFWSKAYGNNYVLDGERQGDLAHWKFWKEDFGKTLFLHREEAEKKLEELNNDDGT